ncbi:MAG: sulfatase-like hydrolase/transferase [bacterium]
MSKIHNFSCSLYIRIMLVVGFFAGIGCNRFQKPLVTPQRMVPKPQNVLLITIDTLRADHLSCYGYAGIQTPAIDGLAKEGMRFEWAFTPVPLTLPSHASIMTGLYPASHGVLNNGEYRLDDSIKTLAQILQQQGLTTAAFVGAFVLSRQFGLDRGFEKYDDDLSQGDESSLDAFSLPSERRGETVTESCIQWLEKENPARFFLWVHYFDPHTTYDPPRSFRSIYPDRPYDGEIAYTDQCIGLLLKALEKLGVIEDTLIILVADHGESLGEHRENTHGIFLYDATVRVPLILHYPGLPEGEVYSQPVRTLDILPTVLDLFKISPPQGLQGKSLLDHPAASHPAPSDPLRLIDASRIDGAVQAGNLSLAGNLSYMDDESVFLETRFPEDNFGWSRLQGVRTRRWKYIHAPRPELYDLSSDPRELHDVLGSYPEQGRSLEKRLQAFLASASQLQAGHQIVEMDEVTRKRLQALGYVQTARISHKEVNDDTKTDPCDVSKDPNNGLSRDPKDLIGTLTIFDQGSKEYSEGNYQKAITSFRQLVRQDPRNILARFLMATALQKIGSLEESLREFQEVARQDTLFINVHNNIGSIHERLNNYEQALAEYQTDIRLHPDNPLSYNNVGVLFLKHSRYEEAREQFEKLLGLNPDLPTQVVAHANLGIAYEMLRMYHKARQEYQQSIHLDPNYVAAYMGLGNVFLKTDKLEQAIEEWQKAVEINPQNADAHFNLGCTFMKQNRLDKAAEHLQEAIQLEPNLWQARMLLEQCRQRKSTRILTPTS